MDIRYVTFSFSLNSLYLSVQSFFLFSRLVLDSLRKATLNLVLGLRLLRNTILNFLLRKMIGDRKDILFVLLLLRKKRSVNDFIVVFLKKYPQVSLKIQNFSLLLLYNLGLLMIDLV